MAKPKDNPLFEEPEFDEKEFLSIERDRAIGIIVIFAIGALSGILAGYLQMAHQTYLAILVMLGFLVVLNRLLKALRIRVSPRASHRIINYGMYIFTWLLFWIILLNPPLNVVSSPQIHSFQVDQSGTWTNLSVTSTGTYSGLTGPNSYSIHLTYKYNFSVPSTNAFYFVQNGNDVAVSGYTYHNGYLNFSLTSIYGDTYDFHVLWTSQKVSNPQALEFTLAVQ